MAFKDWTQSMWDKIKARSPFTQEDQASNLPNGGFGGFRPNTAKQRAIRETQQVPVTEQPQMDPMMTGMSMPPQQTEQANVFGQYTGMTPPQSTSYPGMQPTSFDWLQSYGEPGQQQPMGGYGNTVQFPGAQQPMNGWGGAMQTPNPPQPQPPMENISYMPGNFVGDDGRAYRHCERIAVVTSVPNCYSVLEFMRNRETVIVNTEPITDENENQRCLDMIYGASKALRCSFTRIAGMSIYLVAPEEVMVLPNKDIHRRSDEDVYSRWPQQAAPRQHYDRYGQIQQPPMQEEYNQGYHFRRASGYGR